VSRDGIHWERPDRRPYIGLGLAGEADSHSTYTGLGFVRRGNEIYQYYAGGAGDHAAIGSAPSALMRVAQRLDGFVSANAGPQGGEFVTPPLIYSGRELRLNIDTSAMGTARVELLGPLGAPATGCELRNAEPIITNDVGHLVRWRNGSDVSKFQGIPVALRFVLSNARLYSFQFV